MTQDFISSIQKAVEADAKISKELAEGVQLVLDSFRNRQRAFEEKKKSVTEEIERGSRLTKHRIAL